MSGRGDGGTTRSSGLAEVGTPVARLAANPQLPLPARTRLLRELRSDIRGFAARLVERGVAPEEAVRRAEETLVPAGPALTELERLARPRYRRLTETIDPRRLQLAERAALAVAVTLLVTLGGATLVGAGLPSDPSVYLAGVLATGTATLALVLAKAFQLWIKGAHHRPRRGLGALAALPVITLGLGFMGALLELVALASTAESNPAASLELTTAWVVGSSALVSTAIILALAGGLGWFAIRSWINWAEDAHQAELQRTATDTSPTLSKENS